MRNTVTCPSCKSQLLLPILQPGEGITCPRCLAAVPREPGAAEPAPMAETAAPQEQAGNQQRN